MKTLRGSFSSAIKSLEMLKYDFLDGASNSFVLTGINAADQKVVYIVKFSYY